MQTTMGGPIAATDMDKKIELAERRVITQQARVMEQKEQANAVIKSLEREVQNLDHIKKEWIKKRNLEEERVRVESDDLKKAHRHVIEDLRIKYEHERENKLRDIKMRIQDEEREIKDWQRTRSEAVAKTKQEEEKIKAKFQEQISVLLRDEESVARRGVVRQKRLLDTPNVYTMNIEKPQIFGMKRQVGRGRNY